MAALVERLAYGAFEWSRRQIGFEYLDREDILGGHSRPRCYAARGKAGASILRPLEREARRMGVRIALRSRLRRLLASSGTPQRGDA